MGFPQQLRQFPSQCHFPLLPLPLLLWGPQWSILWITINNVSLICPSPVCLTSIHAHLIPHCTEPFPSLLETSSDFPLAYKVWQKMAQTHLYWFCVTFDPVHWASSFQDLGCSARPSLADMCLCPCILQVHTCTLVVKNPDTRVPLMSLSSSTTYFFVMVDNVSLCVSMSWMMKGCLHHRIIARVRSVDNYKCWKLYLAQS